MPQLFLDCDGVLADFDDYFKKIWGHDPTLFEAQHGPKVLWENLRQHEDFYFKLALMPDARILFDAVSGLNPIILTGRPRNGEWAVEQKMRWTARYFPGVKTIVCLSRDKCHHMYEEGDILVDDRLKYAPFWKDAGGVFVHHKSATESIEELRRLEIL